MSCIAWPGLRGWVDLRWHPPAPRTGFAGDFTGHKLAKPLVAGRDAVFQLVVDHNHGLLRRQPSFYFWP